MQHQLAATIGVLFAMAALAASCGPSLPKDLPLPGFRLPKGAKIVAVSEYSADESSSSSKYGPKRKWTIDCLCARTTEDKFEKAVLEYLAKEKFLSCTIPSGEGNSYLSSDGLIMVTVIKMGAWQMDVEWGGNASEPEKIDVTLEVIERHSPSDQLKYAVPLANS